MSATMILPSALLAAAMCAAVWIGIDAPLPVIPDPSVTPGVAATSDRAEICATDGRPGSAYSRAHRATTIEMKAAVAAAYGVPRSRWREVEFDHVIPLCLGGADSVKNLFPQELGVARRKDHLERYACMAVCAGLVPAAEAQAWFTGDWRVAYQRVFSHSADR